MRCGAVIPLGPPLPTGSSGQPGSGASHAIAPLFGLAPDGVYRAASVTGDAVGSYPQGSPPRRVSPATVSPLPEPSRAIGGLFSVALSVASRRPAVSRHPALWSPDFPLRALRRAATAGRTSRYMIPHGAAEVPYGADFGAVSKTRTPSRCRKVPTTGPSACGSGLSQGCRRQSSVEARYQRPSCSSAHSRSPAS